MATVAYSSLLGLALPTQGDLTGQWGDEVNDYITKYLDASVAGGLAITADVTLTKTTGSALGATSSQYAILTCSPASVNITVTAPAAYKIYVVNNTSASYTVTIRGAGPTTGVILSALEKAVVAWNGTDFFKVATSATDGVSTFSAGSTGLTPSSATSGVVTLAGTLAVANGGTGLASGTSGGVLAYTATGTLASSAALAASALVIGGGAGAAPSTTTTGTGVVTALGVNVGTAGAFVVNGGALGSPSTAGTMPAFTLGGTVSGGGNQINNVVIGTTTPLAGAFTTLTASSTATLNTLVSSGATLTGGTINGMTVGATGQSSGAFTTLSASGRFEESLDIRFMTEGYGIVNAANTARIMTFNNTSITTSVGLAVTGTLSATGTLSGGTSGTAYSFSGSAPATSLTLTSGGDVGIGTSSPTVKLQINQTTAANGIRILSSNATTQNLLALYHNDTTAFVETTYLGSGSFTNLALNSQGGNVGIGTSSPAYKLDVARSGTGFTAKIGNASTATYFYNDGTSTYIGGDSSVNNCMFISAGTNAIGWTTTNGTQKMLLDASGNLGLGVTPSAWTTYKVLQVGNASLAYNNNNTYIGANWFYDGTNKYIAADHALLYSQENGVHGWFTAPSGANANDPITFTQAMTLDSSGNLGIGTSSPTQKLHVASTTNAQGLFKTTGAGGGSNRSSVILESPSNTWYINTNGSDLNGSDGALGFYGNSATRMVIDTSGNLLVGTTSNAGSRKVSVVGSIASTFSDANDIQGVLLTDVNGVYLAATYGSTGSYKPLIFNVSGNEGMRLDTSGNLGLGVTPSAWDSGAYKAIQLGTGIGIGGVIARVDNINQFNLGLNWRYDGGAAREYIASSFATNYEQASGAHAWYTAPTGTAGNNITFTQAMTLDASGNLGVGTTSPSFRLDVQGNIAFNNDAGRNVLIGSTDTAAINYGGGIAFGGYYNGTTNFINDFAGIQGFKENGTAGDYAGGLRFTTRINGGNPTERMRIDSSGNLLVGTTVSAGEITNTAKIKAGTFNTVSGNTSAANNTATTLVTLPSGLGTYIISLGFSGVGDASTYSAVSIVNVDITTTKKTDLVTSSGMVISLSSLAVQGTQTSGSTLNISWSVLRIQ